MEPVLLVNCPREISPNLSDSTAKTMPLGILYLAATLRYYDIHCTTIDAEAFRLSLSDILQVASALRPALIGLNCHTLNRWTVYEIARSLKILTPSATVILGGAHPTLAPVATLDECLAVDAIVVGEGEVTFLEVARSTGNLESIPGLYLRRQGKAASTGRRPRIQALDSLPYPETSDMPLNAYLEYEDPDLPGFWKRASLAATRGCQYRCSFCTEWSFWGASNTARGAESILHEIEVYRKKYRIDRFSFIDDTFTDWPSHHEFCYQAQGSGIYWNCSTRIDHLDPVTIRTLSRGGCREIAVGLESGSLSTLQAVQKDWDNNISTDEVARRIAGCADAGIRMRAHFMIGFPWETQDDITRTVQFAVRLKRYGLCDANFFTVKAYPGTTFTSRLRRTSGIEGVDITEAWSVHDASSSTNPQVAAKLRRFNDIARYSLHPHLDSLSVRALARRAWEIFFSDSDEADVRDRIWEGVHWQE